MEPTEVNSNRFAFVHGGKSLLALCKFCVEHVFRASQKVRRASRSAFASRCRRIAWLRRRPDAPGVPRLLEQTQLVERQVHLALAYRDSYPDEVAEAITQNRRSPQEWQELYPFIEFSTAA